MPDPASHPVTLVHPKAHRTLQGVRYRLHPDEPPVVDVQGRVWWQTIWEKNGWKIQHAH